MDGDTGWPEATDGDAPDADAAQLAGKVNAHANRLRAAAAGARHGMPDLTAALDLLRNDGVLRAVLPSRRGGHGLGVETGSARALCDLLRQIGRTDLSLARLIEGHVNAALLVEVHGAPAARQAMRDAVAGGALLGVWGADGPEPVEWIEGVDGAVHLSGVKRLASGLGHVDRALVTARGRAGGPQRMFLVPADDPARQGYDAWTASAMRATRSGTFDVTGMAVGDIECVGGAGDLMVEPWFEGGVWRYCAAHVGGAEGLIGLWVEHLRRVGHAEDAIQRLRLGRAMAAATAARATVEAAADAVDAAADADAPGIASAVAQALLAREAVESLCAQVLSLAERSLGMAAHNADQPIDGMRRDLSLFLRQAAPDAKLDRAVARALETGVEGLR